MHHCKLSLSAISRKTNAQNLRKWQKKLVLGPIFATLVQIWALKIFSFHCMRSQGKLKNQTWEIGKKSSFGPDFGPFGPNSDHQFFFSKIWLGQSLDTMVSYHHAQYQKKLMIQTWGNLVTDGQTDENDFIGRCPTNVERPKDINMQNV